MKKLIAVLVLLLVIGFSLDFIIGDRAHKWRTIENEKLITDEYIVFLKPKLSNPELIKAFAKRKGINLDTLQIFSEGSFGFVARLNKVQIKSLKGFMYWTGIFTPVTEIRPDFSVQSTRARMQSNPIPQSTRARMQGDYDSTYQSSPGVVYVGGPVTPSDFSRKVWVIDTGIDRMHQDLAAQVIVNGGLARSFVPSEQDPYEDLNGHGTFCAGLIGAKSTNTSDLNVRMNGVAPGAKLVSVKVLNSFGEGSWGRVMLGLTFALQKSSEGDIISMSLGGDYPEACQFFNGSWFNSFRQAVANRKVYVVMSAGNIDETGNPQQQNSSTINFPGCLRGDNFITTGSISVTGMTGGYNVVFSDFSYLGIPAIDFVSPGFKVFSTTSGDNRYEIRSGTSASAAIVSGIIYAKGGELPVGTENIRGNGSDENTNYPIAKIQ
ncbi:S8 family peptidase [Algoriphagus sp.]|uniref:S8 family peptidase n=1 Tax=Algoriphagus sp. TaxID=1872435 RepID=UPI003919F54A